MRASLLYLCVAVLNLRFSVDAERIVDINGGEQFTSIQDCIDDIGEKDVGTCIVREGRYHEEVVVNNKKQITIKGYENERPVLDGTVELKPIEGEWSLDPEKNYCFGTIDQDVFQLFFDNEMMTNARWPNALWKDKTVFDQKYWGHTHETSTQGELIDYDAKTKNKGYRESVLVDDAEKASENGIAGLADSNIDMTGAMAVLNVGSFQTFVKPVLEHEAGSNKFTYIDDFHDIKKKTGAIIDIKYSGRDGRYYLDSSLALLDYPGEWHYNQTSKILSFYPFNDTCPDPLSGDCQCPDVNSGQLRGRVLDYAIDITETARARIENLDFFASTIRAGSSKKKPLREMIVDSVKFDFPSSSKRMLQDFSVPKRTELFASKAKGIVEVRNCEFRGSEGYALGFTGTGNKIYNNLFEWNDWSGQNTLVAGGGSGTVVANGSPKSEFVGNTLRFNGCSAGIRSGKSAIVRDNIIEGQCQGKIMGDGAGVQVTIKNQPNTVLTRNWAFNSPKYALRFDGAPKLKADGKPMALGRHGTMSYNVQWDSGAFQVKGDEHIAKGNLGLGKEDKEKENPMEVNKDMPALKSICILREYPVITNNNTEIVDNALAVASGGSIGKMWKKNEEKFSWAFENCGSEYLASDRTYKKWSLAGMMENNYIGTDIRSLLVDFTNRDFRPLSNDAFTANGLGDIIGENNGQRIGPYPAKGESISQYTIPGKKQMLQASHPIPENGASVNGRDILMFRPGYNCESHTAYVSSVNEAIPDIATAELSVYDEYENNIDNVISIDGLEEGEYKWRVDCNFNGAVEEGEEWTFFVKP